MAGDSLDILGEVLSKFGGLVSAEHARVRTAVVPLLDDSRSSLRKRALQCLGKQAGGASALSRASAANANPGC